MPTNRDPARREIEGRPAGGEANPIDVTNSLRDGSGPFADLKRLIGMPSTVIKRFDYRPENAELEILFVTGRRYVYADVPPEEVEAFRAAFSKGSHFNRHIRDRYACRELVD